jgi:AraC family transcriptional regulator
MTPAASLDGVLLRSAAVAGFTFTETVHAPGARLGAHAHPSAYFCLVRAGGFRERWRHGTADEWAGGALFRAAAEEHENSFGEEGARCFNVALTQGLLEGLGSLPRRARPAGHRVRGLLVRLCREVARPSASPLVVEGLVYQALGETFERDGRAGHDWLEHVRAAIEQRYGRPLSIGGLAAEVGVHPVHLSRAFHRRFGVPVLAFVREVRVRAAAALLRDTHRGLADVAVEAGFSDQSHLTRVFKRTTGFTPAHFRRRRP